MSFIPAAAVDPVSGSPVNELRGVFAHFPDGLGAFDQMYERMVGKGRLELTMRLVILGASARWRSDDYIAAAMFGQALEEGLDASTLGSIIDDAEGSSPAGPEALLLAFCRKATESAFKMVQRDVDALNDVGWSTGQIVEATSMVSLSGYMTVMSAAGGLLRTPGLEAEPWR